MKVSQAQEGPVELLAKDRRDCLAPDREAYYQNWVPRGKVDQGGEWAARLRGLL